MLRMLLMLIGLLAAVLGLGILISARTGSVNAGIAATYILILGGFFGWMFRDIYRRGVGQAKEEEERNAGAPNLRRGANDVAQARKVGELLGRRRGQSPRLAARRLLV
jgi:hypothetical protein